MRIARLLLLPALSLLGAVASAAEFGGTWIGRYGQGANTVYFSLVLRQDGKQLVGRMIEPNTFGQRDADHLSAIIVGEVEGTTVRLFKKYDGTGQQHHSVSYRGTFADGLLTGTWELGGGASGPFTMRLVDESLFTAAKVEQPGRF